MALRKESIALLVGCGILFFLLSFTFNDWLSRTMPRHQLIQLPLMFLIGLVLGIRFLWRKQISVSWALAVLIAIMASFIFWMIPYSVDLSVINSSFNRLMHINMLLAGLLTVISLRNSILEVKIIFLGMMATMLTASGITLINFKILLCSSFNLAQQNQTGKGLLSIGILLFIFTVVKFFRESVREPSKG